MIQSAWTWAASHGLIRRNPIHGEEEARLILTDSFEIAELTATETSMEGRVEMEDCKKLNPTKP